MRSTPRLLESSRRNLRQDDAWPQNISVVFGYASWILTLKFSIQMRGLIRSTLLSLAHRPFRMSHHLAIIFASMYIRKIELLSV